ncbi:hypothetical protein DYB32_003553 [Aphanomyces invadans]|uniref:RRM domain-containing protein n=1 Tax=Aphanomyces invadans TaxID=157072 RepID=A0A418B0I4_9STRA|nr:hypothetical protein DYB32_003553 [Aphanomyces invadans]
MMSSCVRRLAMTSKMNLVIGANAMHVANGNAMSLRPWTVLSLTHARAMSSEVPRPVVSTSCVWIGGLPYDSKYNDVRQRFEVHGKIKKLEFPTTPDGRSNGTCYITYETPEEAALALSENESMFGSRWIRVKHLRDLNTNARSANTNSTPNSKVFIGNLPYNFTEGDVTELLSSCGTVLNVNLVVDNENKSRGFGFAHFETAEAAAAAVKLNGTFLQGRPVSINYSLRAPAQGRGTAMADTIFVANLPHDVEEETLESMFDHCGAIESIRLAKDQETGRSRGFAHITFAMPEGAKKAIGLNGAQIDANTIGVELAITKAQKRRRWDNKSDTPSVDTE